MSLVSISIDIQHVNQNFYESTQKNDFIWTKECNFEVAIRDAKRYRKNGLFLPFGVEKCQKEDFLTQK